MVDRQAHTSSQLSVRQVGRQAGRLVHGIQSREMGCEKGRQVGGGTANITTITTTTIASPAIFLPN
jgi:hypothetical protein